MKSRKCISIVLVVTFSMCVVNAWFANLAFEDAARSFPGNWSIPIWLLRLKFIYTIVPLFIFGLLIRFHFKTIGSGKLLAAVMFLSAVHCGTCALFLHKVIYELILLNSIEWE
jgi:hypothetical protein